MERDLSLDLDVLDKVRKPDCAKIQESDSVNDDNQLLVGTPDDHASQPQIGIDLESDRKERSSNQKSRAKKKKKSRG